MRTSKWRSDLNAREYDCGCLQSAEGTGRCILHETSHSYPWDDGVNLNPTQSNILESETIITDPYTGGQKGSKQAQLGALEPRALIEVGKVAGFGAGKYERYNFLKGYQWSLSYDALQRHLLAFWAGEDFDPESGLHHLGHAAWHCLALLAFTLHRRGTDDRWRP